MPESIGLAVIWRRHLTRALRRAIFAVATIVVAFIGLLAFGPVFDSKFLKGRVEESLSSQLGIEVSLASLEATLGFRVELQVRELRLETPSVGSAWEEILSVDLARLHLALLPLLRHRLDIDEMRIEGVRTSVGSWGAFDTARKMAEPVDSESGWEVVGIETLSLGDLEIKIDRLETAEPSLLRVASMEGRITRNRPVELSIEGTFDDLSFATNLASGTLESLIQSGVVPLKGSGSIGQVELAVDGSVDLGSGEWVVDADIGLEASDLARLGDLWGANLPEAGPLRAGGQLVVTGSGVALRGAQITLAGTTLRGALQVDSSGVRPSVSGQLVVDSVDVRDWILESESTDPEAALSVDLSGVEQLLAGFDAAVTLEVAHVEGLPLAVADLKMSSTLSDGALIVAFAARIAGSPASGSVEIRGADQGAEVALNFTALAAHDLIPGETGLSVERASVNARGSGSTARELLTSMAIELSAEGLALDYRGQDDQMVPIRFSNVRMEKREARIELSALGSLSEIPVEVGAFVGLPQGLDRSATWPLEISARAASTEIELEGTVIPRRGDIELAGRFGVRGEVSRESQVTFELEGHQSFSGGLLNVVLEQGRLGRSTLSGELQGGEIPHLTIRSSLIDLEEIRRLLPVEGEVVTASGHLDLDMPILPAGIDLINVDVDVAVARIQGESTVFEQIETSLRVRDGRLQPSKFQLVDGSTLFEGQVSMDLQREEPQLQLELEARDVNLDTLLRRHGLAQGFTLESDKLRLILVARGSSLRELLTRSDVKASASHVLIRMEETEPGKALQAELERIELEAVGGQLARLHVLGALNERPFQLDFEIASWEERSPGDSLPVQVTLESGVRSLRLETQIRLPLDLFQMEHHFVLEGDDLFEFMEQGEDRPFRTGPFRLEAVIKGRPDAYSLDRVRLNTGGSVIEGAGSLNTEAEIPRIELRISSERLVLEDFLDPVLRTKLEEATRESVPEATTMETQPDSLRDLTQLRENLGSFVASVDLGLGAVVLGDELLGNAEVSIDLDDGALGVTASFSQATGGSAIVGLQLNADGDRIAGSLLAKTANLDLGSLIERFELEDLDAGRLALDLEVSFDGPTPEEVLASANGHLDATYYPEGADTKLLDLWAGPLFKVALPATGSEPSKMNCIVTWFTINEGRMTSDAFYLDTSRMRARGTGGIDLSTGELDFKLSPRPKSRNFLNLATPIRVQGTWDDPSIGFTRGGLAGTLLKLYLWTITVWRDLTRSPLPADGSDICLAPLPRSEATQLSTAPDS